MKLIIISGPVCAGKTTVVSRLMEKAERYFHLSYDSLKWEFSQYSSGKYADDILTLRLSMLRTLCEMNYNVLTESTHATTKQKHIAIAREYGYDIVQINLEADRDVLWKRCQDRNMSDSKRTVSAARFDEVFTVYEREKNPSALTFKTDTATVDDVVSAISKLL